MVFNYSSKVWTAEQFNYWHEVTATGNNYNPYDVVNATDVYAYFARHSLSGWTGGLTPPTIIEELELYDQNGNNFLIASPGGSPSNQPNFVACESLGFSRMFTAACPSGVGVFETLRCGDGSISLRLDYCEEPESGGGGPPDPVPVPTPAPPIQHLVKRIRVQMPSGQRVEFRQDDQIFNCHATPAACAAGRAGTYLAVDGSRLRLELEETQPGGAKRDVLYLPDGGRFLFGTGAAYQLGHTYIDAQGNTETYDVVQQVWRDTLGRTVPNLLPWDYIGGMAPNVGPQTISLPGLNGTAQNYTLHWQELKPAACVTGTEAACQASALENPAETLAHIGDDSCLSEADNPTSPALFHSDPVHQHSEATTNGTGVVDFTEKYRLCDSTMRSAVGPFNPRLLGGITLPNGTQYKFKYNRYGEMTRIEYPTGGSERFVYGFVPSVSDGASSLYNQTNRGVLERWVEAADGTPLQHWQYSATATNTTHLTVTTIAPDNTLSENLYRAFSGSAFGFSNPLDGTLSESRHYAAPDANQQRPLRRRLLQEMVVTPAAHSTSLLYARDARLSRTLTLTFEPGATHAVAQLTTQDYDPAGTGGANSFAQLNVTRAKTYHAVAVPVATAQSAAFATLASYFSDAQLAAVTENDYLYDPAYQARNLTSLVTATRLYAGTNPTPVSKTQFQYDQGTYLNAGNCALSGNLANTWTPPLNGTTALGRITTTRTFSDPNNSATALEAHAWYDLYGNVVQTSDPLGHTASIAFTPAFGCAYPVSATGPVPDSAGLYASNQAFTTTTDYDFMTGLGLTTTDANNLTTATDYDAYLRPQKVTPPAGGAVSETEYHDTPTLMPAWGQKAVWVKNRTQVSATHWAESVEYFDGLGRSVRSYRKNDPATQTDPNCVWSATATEYDVMGRVERVSQPFCALTAGTGTPGAEWTTTTYDDLGRVLTVTTPDGAQVQTSYGLVNSSDVVGTTVTVTDPAGKQRRSVTDGLGRLVRVDEPANPTPAQPHGTLGAVESPAQPTWYTYDVQGNLRRVEQDGQKRYFLYDALGRLLAAKQPEQDNLTPDNDFSLPAQEPVTQDATGWSVAYRYDAAGNLVQRKDARNILTSYTYDALNRNTSTTYSDGTPTVKRYYDGFRDGTARHAQTLHGVTLALPRVKGQLWQTETAQRALVTLDDLDALGRPQRLTQHFPSWTAVGGDEMQFAWSAPFTVRQSYRPGGGQVAQLTYPSGHSVSYQYDAVGRAGDAPPPVPSPTPTPGATPTPTPLPAFGGNLGDGVTRRYSDTPRYDARGLLTTERYGTVQPLYHKQQYNGRGQLWDVQLGTDPATTGANAFNRGRLQNIYTPNSAATPASLTAAQTTSPHNNGNLHRQHILLPDGSYWQQNYTYDEVNRLQTATETRFTPDPNNPQTLTPTPTWGQTFDYDRWGNRLLTTANNATWGFATAPVAYEKELPRNRLLGPGDTNRNEADRLLRYDAAGNLTWDSTLPQTSGGGGTRTFDAENRLTGASTRNEGVTQWQYYAYDGDGRRIVRQVNGTVTWQVTGFGGELLAEYAAQAVTILPQKEYGYHGGKLLITAASGDAQRLRRFVENIYYRTWGYLPTGGKRQADINALVTALTNAGQGQTNAAAMLHTARQQLTAAFDHENYQGVSRTHEQYVADLYLAYLQRAPESPAILAQWASYLYQGQLTPAQMRQEFADSGEFAALVSSLYGTESGDYARLDRFLQQVYASATGSGATQAQLDTEHALFDTAEANGVTALQTAAQELGRRLLGGPVNFRPDISTNEEYVTRLYQTFLRRAPDSSFNAYVTQASAPNGRSAVLEQFLSMSAYRERSAALYREINWLVADHLGTPRWIVERTGSVAGLKRSDYLPFGESANSLGGRGAIPGYSGENVRQGFTNHEEDTETGLVYANARYLAAPQGRFVSVDPLLASGKPDLPQSWNRYAYVGNNPLVFSDPTGEDWYYSADQDKYQWAFRAPGYGYSKVENFTYYAGEAHQWVALNPFSNTWTNGHSSAQTAEDSIDGSFTGWKTLQFFAGLSGVGEGSIANMGKILGLELPYVNEHSMPHRGGAGASTALQITALPAIGGAMAEARAVAGAAELAPTASATNCFVAGTLIHTARGLTTIEAVKLGDQVLSYNEQVGQIEYQEVTRLYRNTAQVFLKIRVTGEAGPITVTLGHPFYVYRNRDDLAGDEPGGDWVLSQSLRVGDLLKGKTGVWQPILSLEKVKRTNTTYNFEVAKNHNYFVGQNGWLVHNQSLRTYEVGTYSNLKSRSVPGDQLDVHHVVQKQPASQVIPGYNPRIAPSIALPQAEHRLIPNLRGTFNGTARQILARDVRNLRNFTNAPPASIRQLIDFNRQLYPDSFR